MYEETGLFAKFLNKIMSFWLNLSQIQSKINPFLQSISLEKKKLEEQMFVTFFHS